MDGSTTDGRHITYYQHESNDDNDAVYVNGELSMKGGRLTVMRHTLKLLGVETRISTDHIYKGDYVHDLGDIRLKKRQDLRKRAHDLETEGATIVAALGEISGQYWGPFSDDTTDERVPDDDA